MSEMNTTNTVPAKPITVGRILGHRAAGDVGIEIEVEAKDPLPEAIPQPWLVKVDNSLRGHAREYCTSKAILCDGNLLTTVQSLTGLFNQKSIIHDSTRTSLHVHVNITRHTPLQLWTAVTAYWMLENALVKYCGEDYREGNVFCLRVADAERLVFSALHAIDSKDIFDGLHGENLKYAGQNLNAITNYGSLEYRTMKGTVDPAVITLWTQEMYNIVHRSKRFRNPADVMDTYRRDGAEAFANAVLSSSFVSILKSYGDVNALVRQNVGLLLPLCYHTDWSAWEESVNKRYAYLDAPKAKSPRASMIPPRRPLNAIMDEWAASTVPRR